jgi:hypothetical protein
MIACQPAPFIFVHIPKCGGTSIERALMPAATGRHSFADLSPTQAHRHCLPGSPGWQHAKLGDYEAQFKLNNFFKFAIVRNPWERAVSQIEFLQPRSARLFLGMTFKENLFIYCHSQCIVQAHDLGASQLDYLLDRSGKMRVDYLGRFESLLADFHTICSRLGLSPAPALPHSNNAKRRIHYSAYYDEESVEWIRRRFAKDINYFGYRFEPVSLTVAQETP